MFHRSVLIFALFLLDLVDVSKAATQQQSWDALKDVHESLGGPKWKSVKWDITVAPTCNGTGHVPSYPGVRCDASAPAGTVAVTALDITATDDDLDGKLPQSDAFISAFASSLTRISFPLEEFLHRRHKNIDGSLPAKWKALTALTEIELGGLYLSGTLPTEWSSLTKLRRFDVLGNLLTGAVPASWCAWADLEHFSLKYNMLTGDFPTCFLAKLSKLQNITAVHNKLTGTLPDTIASPVLHSIMLSSNQMSGTIPSWCNTAAKSGGVIPIRVVWLGGNKFTGSMPPAWGMCGGRLTEIDLSSNLLSGTLPPEWSQMRNLKVLQIFGNTLTGDLPKEWSQLSSVTELSLNDNRLSGTYPEEWKLLSALDMMLNGNRLTGSFSCASLRDITLLNDNVLSGTLPASCADEVKLMKVVSSRIELQGNLITGTLPDGWKDMPIAKLDLAGNELEGTLPAAWGTAGSALVKNLAFLRLGDNHIHGTMPESWGNLVKLHSLDIASNDISGTIPSAWAKLTDLKILSIGPNAGITFANLPTTTFSSVELLILNHIPISAMPVGFSKAFPNLIKLSARSVPLQKLSDADLPLSLKYLDVYHHNFSQSELEPELIKRVKSMTYVSVHPKKSGMDPLPHVLSTQGFASSKVGPYMIRPLNFSEPAFTAIATNQPVTSQFCCNFIEAALLDRRLRLHKSGNELSAAFEFRDALLDTSCMRKTCFVDLILPRYFVEITPTIHPHLDTMTWSGKPIVLNPELSGVFNVTLPLYSGLKHGVDYHIVFKVRVHDNHDWVGSSVYSSYVAAKDTIHYTGEMEIETLTMHSVPCSPDLMAVPNKVTCQKCPHFSICDGTSNIIAKPKFWRPSKDSLPLFHCAFGAGGCDREGSDGTTCREGHHGFLCAQCEHGYSSTLFHNCAKCPPMAATWVIFILVTIVSIAYTTFSALSGVDEWGERTDGNSGDLNDPLAQSEAQHIAIEEKAEAIAEDAALADESTHHRGKLGSMMSAFSPSASKHTGHLKKGVQHASSYALPIFVAIKTTLNHLSLAGLVAKTTFVRHMVMSSSPVEMLKWIAAVQTAMATVNVFRLAQCSLHVHTVWEHMIFSYSHLAVLLFFESIVAVVLATTQANFPGIVYTFYRVMSVTFQASYEGVMEVISEALEFCDMYEFKSIDAPSHGETAAAAHGGAPAEHGAHHEYITLRSSDRTMECTSVSNWTTYNTMVLFAWMGVIFIGIGVPLGLRYLFSVIERREGKTRALKMFAFLSENFSEERWYWELVIMIRKLSAELLLAAVPKVAGQMQVLLFFYVFWGVVHHHYQPFGHTMFNHLEYVSLGIGFLSTNAMMLVQSSEAALLGGEAAGLPEEDVNLHMIMDASLISVGVANLLGFCVAIYTVSRYVHFEWFVLRKKTEVEVALEHSLEMKNEAVSESLCVPAAAEMSSADVQN
eukprot:PhM_4_TR1339/c0_g1_i1/m.48581